MAEIPRRTQWRDTTFHYSVGRNSFWIDAVRDGESAGQVEVTVWSDDPSFPGPKIEGIGVTDPSERGLGTKLYELAAEVTCAMTEGTFALGSDTTRSPFAEAFWRKQERKGRAVCADSSGGKAYMEPLVETEDALVERFGAEEGMRRLQQSLERLPRPVYQSRDDQGSWPCRRWELKSCNVRDLSGLGRYKIRSKR